jgi:hypothetical protein
MMLFRITVEMNRFRIERKPRNDSHSPQRFKRPIYRVARKAGHRATQRLPDDFGRRMTAARRDFPKDFHPLRRELQARSTAQVSEMALASFSNLRGFKMQHKEPPGNRISSYIRIVRNNSLSVKYLLWRLS